MEEIIKCLNILIEKSESHFNYFFIERNFLDQIDEILMKLRGTDFKIEIVVSSLISKILEIQPNFKEKIQQTNIII
jgi:hypothetical protein